MTLSGRGLDTSQGEILPLTCAGLHRQLCGAPGQALITSTLTQLPSQMVAQNAAAVPGAQSCLVKCMRPSSPEGLHNHYSTVHEAAASPLACLSLQRQSHQWSMIQQLVPVCLQVLPRPQPAAQRAAPAVQGSHHG